VASYIFARMAAGVPTGASNPFQPSTSKPGRPDSATVGTSGSSGIRSRPVTALARNLPARIWGNTLGGLSNISWQEPEIRSATAGPLPR
jgi:hypothetical protein